MKSILLLIISNIWGAGEVALQDISQKIEDGKAVIEYTFNDNVDSRKVGLDFINKTLQLDVPNAFLEEKKRFTNVEDEKIRNLYSYQLNNDTLRLRVIYDDLSADDLQDKVNVKFSGNKMRVFIDDGRVPLKQAETKRPEKTISAPTIQVEDLVMESEEEDTERSSVKTVSVEQEKSPEEMKKESAYDESAIPVFAGNMKEEEKEASSSLNAMVIGFSVLAAFILAAFLLLKRWSKVKFKNPHTHIKVLTQHHLGPKKSLAIVSVAGESILIGVTDQNINMIKSLSLLDEEIPEETPKKFDSAFDKEEQRLQDKEDGVEEDSFNIQGIKDVVTTKLQNMREL